LAHRATVELKGQWLHVAVIDVNNKQRKVIDMNNLTWIGIVVWGLLMAGFGLLSASPVPAVASTAVQAHDALFLISGGLMTSMIGMAGLAGLMGQRASVVKRTK
jgi:hypothetical protein